MKPGDLVTICYESVLLRSERYSRDSYMHPTGYFTMKNEITKHDVLLIIATAHNPDAHTDDTRNEALVLTKHSCGWIFMGLLAVFR